MCSILVKITEIIYVIEMLHWNAYHSSFVSDFHISIGNKGNTIYFWYELLREFFQDFWDKCNYDCIHVKLVVVLGIRKQMKVLESSKR